MKAWFSKQRWHFIYGLIVLCLLAGTIWQRVVVIEQRVEVKALAEHVVKDHVAMIQHMYQAHGIAPPHRVAPQLERF